MEQCLVFAIRFLFILSTSLGYISSQQPFQNVSPHYDVSEQF